VLDPPEYPMGALDWYPVDVGFASRAHPTKLQTTSAAVLARNQPRKSR
jgi:hypothetical protein